MEFGAFFKLQETTNSLKHFFRTFFCKVIDSMGDNLLFNNKILFLLIIVKKTIKRRRLKFGCDNPHNVITAHIIFFLHYSLHIL